MQRIILPQALENPTMTLDLFAFFGTLATCLIFFSTRVGSYGAMQVKNGYDASLDLGMFLVAMFTLIVVSSGLQKYFDDKGCQPMHQLTGRLALSVATQNGHKCKMIETLRPDGVWNHHPC
jgi:hypothetical protein